MWLTWSGTSGCGACFSAFQSWSGHSLCSPFLKRLFLVRSDAAHLESPVTRKDAGKNSLEFGVPPKSANRLVRSCKTCYGLCTTYSPKALSIRQKRTKISVAKLNALVISGKNFDYTDFVALSSFQEISRGSTFKSIFFTWKHITTKTGRQRRLYVTLWLVINDVTRINAVLLSSF